MGLFSKKREESNVTPVQPSRPEVSPVLVLERDSEPELVVSPRPQASPTFTPAPAPASTPSPAPGFGIQNAMELMRKLPPDNIPLVVSVVKTTLESLHIDVESIIEDAKVKRAKIAERISGLEAEITDLEEEVAARREEIKSLRDDAAETKQVQERLQLTTVDVVPVGASRPELAAPLLRPPGG